MLDFTDYRIERMESDETKAMSASHPLLVED
jgi:hypothetical protein